MEQCKLCLKSLATRGALSQHVRRYHKEVSPEEYVWKHEMKLSSPPKCLREQCNKPAAFNFLKYGTYCSHQCCALHNHEQGLIDTSKLTARWATRGQQDQDLEVAVNE